MTVHGAQWLEALPDPVKANDCVWELPKNELLAQHLGRPKWTAKDGTIHVGSSDHQ